MHEEQALFSLLIMRWARKKTFKSGLLDKTLGSFAYRVCKNPFEGRIHHGFLYSSETSVHFTLSADLFWKPTILKANYLHSLVSFGSGELIRLF